MSSSPSSFLPSRLPGVFLPSPVIPAIIELNRKTVIDRKKRRKAEFHKTILCRAWAESGRCNYGPRCKFAHGDEERRRSLEETKKSERGDEFSNPLYRTAPCAKFYVLGACPYGDRCTYIHEVEKNINIEKCIEDMIGDDSPNFSDTSSTRSSSSSTSSCYSPMDVFHEASAPSIEFPVLGPPSGFPTPL